MPYHPTVLLYFQKENFQYNHNTPIKIRKLTHISPSDPI